ncbi:MAG: PfkB family carbohydrate kinase [Candidatus Caldarchaeum sp.]
MLAVVGALTIDIINGRKFIGGPPWYAGTAAASLSNDVSVYSAVGDDFPENFTTLMQQRRLNISRVKKVSGAKTYTFEHKYTKRGRVSRITAEGPRIPVDALLDIDADTALLSPVHREADEEHLRLLRKNVSMLAADLQGFIRKIDHQGMVKLQSRDVSEILKTVDVLHCSEEEAIAVTGKVDVVSAARVLGLGTDAVVLVGSADGLYIAHRSSLSLLRLTASGHDLTGAGDMLTGFFLTFYAETANSLEAAAHALHHLSTALLNPPPDRVKPTPRQPPVKVEHAWTRRI